MYKKNISAAPGQPSTFWSSDNIHWYRTKAEAEKNDVSKAVDPAQYEIKKSFFAQHKALCITLIVAAIVAAGYYGYKKGWFNKILKR